MSFLIALIITFLAGFSFWIGALITKFIKNKKMLNEISIAMAFVVMIGLIIFDFIPDLKEIYESISLSKKIINIVFYVMLGVVILKCLDVFVPDHHHDHKEDHDDMKEHNNHLFHIGVITSISLIIHNIIEGLSIYNMALNDVKSGILMALGVSLHNIPLGISIFATMDIDKLKRSKRMILMTILSLSTIIGALVVYLIGGVMGEYMQGTLVCMTLGMVIYIAIFELLKEYIEHIRSKYSLIGTLLGIIVIGFALII